jgi:branched-chain amino acid transport system permease protein
MQILFKTDYDQDIDHLVNKGERFRVIGLITLAIAAPLLIESYYLTELSMFLVYALAGIGLTVVVGFSGQVSFGHAAFLGIGAYTHSILIKHGVPFEAALLLAGLFSGLIGALLGRAASSMHGFYLAIATLAFVIIVETIIGEWTLMTGGYMGMPVLEMSILGFELDQPWQQYFVILSIFLFFVWGVANIMRSPSGRAMIAVRDSETSARSLGINVRNTKILAFFISTVITGVAGGLFAHQMFFLSPEIFGINESLKLLMMVIVGGLGTITGVIYGAVFISFLPNIIDLIKIVLPEAIATKSGMEQLMLGLTIAGFIIFEPTGIYGRWLKIRLFFETFPYYKKATFVKQKQYLKTERFR